MATHTPMAPQPSPIPRITLKRMRNTTIENMEINMQNFTSPAARNALGIVKAVGHKKIAIPSWIITRIYAYRYASGESENNFKISGRPSKMTALITMVIIYVIFHNRLV